MLSGEHLRIALNEFIATIENGDLVVDAVVVLSYVDQSALEEDHTKYGMVTYGTMAPHRTIGLLEMQAFMSREQVRRQM